MLLKSKFKLATALGIMLSMLSLLVHLFLANYSAGGITKGSMRMDDVLPFGPRPRPRRLWGPWSKLDHLHPFAKPSKPYAASGKHNGFIYAKIYGGFEKIQSSICDLVAVARLLNATLVIPEIQATTRAKGISPKFKSFSYLYDEDHFIDALSGDVAISILPASLEEFQRLRCRVAFHALRLRPQIQALGSQIVGRLRASGRPYLAYHPGLLRDTLAFHGCAELFQDIHTELIQYRRNQMIKRGTVKEQLTIDSVSRKMAGLCPLMPEELGQKILYPRICLTPHLPKVKNNSLKNGRGQGLVQDRYPHLLQGHSMPMRRKAADAFFPGFHNDGSGWPDYSSLIMGHRLYQTPSGITYRPDRTPKSPAVQPVKDSNGRFLFGGEEECPDWMARSLAMVSAKNNEPQNEDYEDELPEDDSSPDTQQESYRSDANKSSEQDEEMDPDD
nr:unnamed protein product [Digitaria exilis]